MLTRIAIKNFRSIRDAKIAFGGSGLTVIVGANGSGKSNLVKMLEFLAAVARSGLDAPILNRGREGFVPKAIAPAEIDGTPFDVEYEIALPLFGDYPKDAPPLKVTHAFQLLYHSDVPPLKNPSRASSMGNRSVNGTHSNRSSRAGSSGDTHDSLAAGSRNH